MVSPAIVSDATTDALFAGDTSGMRAEDGWVSERCLTVGAVHADLPAMPAGFERSHSRNNQLLLEQLADVPDERRTAHFTCAVAFCHPDGTELVVEGTMPGRIIREQRGDNGFGYDVVFVADETGPPERTTAELPSDEKDAISHRGRALRKIAPLIAAALK